LLLLPLSNRHRNLLPCPLFSYTVLWYIHPLLSGDCKQRPLLGNMQQQNNGFMQPISKQWLSKHVPAETNMRTTIEELCFLCGSCQGVILKPIKLTSSVKWTEVFGWWVREFSCRTFARQLMMSAQEAEESSLLEAIARDWLLKI
jgi:hypothetical protein